MARSKFARFSEEAQLDKVKMALHACKPGNETLKSCAADLNKATVHRLQYHCALTCAALAVASSCILSEAVIAAFA